MRTPIMLSSILNVLDISAPCCTATGSSFLAQLAVGAYGWRERAVSLMQMIQAGGGQLVPSFSAARQSGKVTGIKWFNGKLESILLPQTSTA